MKKRGEVIVKYKDKVVYMPVSNMLQARIMAKREAKNKETKSVEIKMWIK